MSRVRIVVRKLKCPVLLLFYFHFQALPVMKSVNLFSVGRYILLLTAGTLFFFSCNKALTQSDVQDQLGDAREATAEAKEETAEAIAAREQYYDDYKETRIAELEDRIKDIDKRIKDLRKTAKKSENASAAANIESAVANLQEEKSDINGKIADVQAIKTKDWSDSYEELNQAVSRIEGEINKLSESLGTSSN